ncbi:hypothetical protein C8R44DRAFT_534828, partial [Mycena epipterygia]
MQADRANIQAHYEDCRSVFSPIRRLPSEILVQIFALCSDPVFNDEEIAKRWWSDPIACLAQEALLTVAQVCARWHSVVLGTPTLWNTIDLQNPALWRASKQTERAMGLLRLALERIAKAPLDLAV